MWASAPTGMDPSASLRMTGEADGVKDIQEQAERLLGEICDHYCKYPEVCASQEDLDAICDGCPLATMIAAEA